MSSLLKKVTSVVATGAVVLTAVGTTAGVNADYTYVEAANKLANQDVIVDQSSNPSAYRLADTIQRQEALKVMMRLSGLTVNEGACNSPFSDIRDTDWACKYAVAALSAGFIAANDTFRPSDEVSKIEGLKMVMQARGIEREENSNWQAGYVNTAVAEGIANPFSDYNTSVERGLMFVWAAEAITTDVAVEEVMEEEDEISLEELLGLGDLTEEPAETTTVEEAVETVETETSEETTVVVSGDDMLMVSLNPETPSDGLAQANTARIPLLVFDVKAGSEDVTLNEATLEFIGLGAYTRLDDVSIYNQIGEKVSKTKDFSEISREISFDKDVVVEAGTTMTLTIAGKITQDGDDNATYGVKLVDLQASSEVEGEGLVGALLVPAVFSNVASLEVDADKASGNITVGDTETLAEFDIEEKNDNEDVLIKTITLHLTGTVDEDDLANLTLFADGEEIASDLMINSDDEIVAVVDYELAADEKVTFELTGSITGSVGDTVDFAFESNDDIYAVGANSGMPVSVATTISTQDLSTARTIEGAEINVSFEKGDRDEARPDSEGVVAGTLKMLSFTDNYEVTKLTVTVTATGLPTNGTVEGAIEDLELGGVSFDSVSNGVYTFEDIALNANEEENLDLTFDVVDDNAYNGTKLKFQVAITEVEDDEEDVTYPSTGYSLSSILSSTSLDNKSIDIETGSITVTNVNVTDRDLVIGNGVETVLYKAKISVGDADSITINDFNLVEATGHTVTEDLDKIMDSATLNIGGQTFDGDINSDSVDFTGISATIAAGADNVELLITAILKDNDDVNNGEVLAMMLDTANLDMDDSDGDSLESSSAITTSANNKLTKTNLKEQGTFEFAIVNDGDNKDDVENVILAGTSNVALAEFTMEADLEDIDVNSLKINVAGTTTTAATSAVTGSAITFAESTTTSNAAASTGTAAQTQITEMTTNDALNNVGMVSVNVSGTIVEDATFAGLATKVQANSKVATAVFDDATDKITVTAQTAGTPFTLNDYKFNGSTDSTLTIATTQINKAAQGATVAVKEVKTITLSRAMVDSDTDDVVTHTGTATTTATTIADLATKLAAEPTVGTATVSGNVITLTAATAGTAIANASASTLSHTTAYVTNATSSGSAVADLSDTLTNIRLMDGSTVIADGGTATYDSTNNVTVIEFEDFTVVDGEDEIEGTIVADIRTYTTNGDETSAVLGGVTIVAGAIDVEGVQSDNVITASTAGTVTSNTVSIVPALVTVSIDNTLGTDDEYAKITFNIDQGNNTLDNDDVKITSLTLEKVTQYDLRDDDGNAILTSITSAANTAQVLSSNNDIDDGDTFEFVVNDTTNTNNEIRIVEDSIKYTIDGGTEYIVDTSSVTDLKKYIKN